MAKRLFDILMALIALTIFSIPMLFVGSDFVGGEN